ncbi:DUF1212 domain containing protein [Niveomyces insectorum RCEF 264]|uniref:DUF1212 domain containing protein n=1 Tax=Niveomyces insectorum RCEF 264 TaxID=1081102 RepID=A0A167XZ35_9HYPO|nr:DUF1212 domain containing protein [Niveomyces insectorum RCEF 264]
MTSTNSSVPSFDGAGSPPPSKGKEKKRVGFTEGRDTPSHEQPVSQPGSASGSRTGPGIDPHDFDEQSHDGIDHDELTRALSRILQDEAQDGSRPGIRFSPAPTFAVASASAPVTAPSASPRASQRQSVTPPAPPYFPPARQEQQQQSEKAAKERADRLAESVGRAYASPDAARGRSPEGSPAADLEALAADSGRARRRSSIFRFRRPEDDENGSDRNDERDRDDSPGLEHARTTALHLVQSHAMGTIPETPVLARTAPEGNGFHYDASLANTTAGRSGYSTPTAMFDHDVREYVPPPSKYQNGILASLLRLYNQNNNAGNAPSTSNSAANSEQSTPIGTPSSSRATSPGPGDGSMTPKRRSGLFTWKNGKHPHEHSSPDLPSQSPKTEGGRPWSVWHPNHRHTGSTTSLSAGLLGTSSIFAAAGSADIGQAVTERVKRERPPLKRNRHSGNLFGVVPSSKSQDGSGSGGGGEGDQRRRRRKRREEEQMRITVHIANVLSRHRYLTTLCRALMMYGAPTHRLEDYLRMSARVLEIEAQFLYIPGCMLVSFDDSSTHTAEVKLVRAPQGVDLGKLSDVHVLYKEVIHDLISVDEATTRLHTVITRKPKYKIWLRVFVYGLASVCVAPFAFGGRFIDLPIAFVLGCIVGLLALVAAPSNAMYANVFEISAAVITSFLARAAGSIAGGRIFCFAALAQSSIALILPGYMVLCSSLELQSQNIVAGSVRMVYAMIYTLFLGYGITIGTAVYGAIDKSSVSDTTCSNSLTRPWYFLFVPLFTICLCIINQAKWRQIPIMVVISVAGFAVNTYASSYFSRNAQLPNTLGALCVGVLANLYARTSRYFELYFMKMWAQYGQPCVHSIRHRRQQWRGSGGRRSRRGRSSRMRGDVTDGLGVGTGTDSDEYLNLPPYRKRSTSRDAEEGHANSRSNNTHPPTAAEADAAAAEAERKAPGSTEVIGYGLAAAAMLPAIFVQVPSGLAVNGSLLSGINAANELTGNTTSSAAASSGSNVNSVAFTVLLSVIQVAIGITVGLFLSALIVYPLGKRRSALFSF